eukprot:gene15580-21679_t
MTLPLYACNADAASLLPWLLGTAAASSITTAAALYAQGSISKNNEQENMEQDNNRTYTASPSLGQRAERAEKADALRRERLTKAGPAKLRAKRAAAAAGQEVEVEAVAWKLPFSMGDTKGLPPRELDVPKPAATGPKLFGARRQAPEPEPTRPSFSLPSFSRKEPDVANAAPPELKRLSFGARLQAPEPEPEPIRSSFSLPSFSFREPEIPTPAPPAPKRFGARRQAPEPVPEPTRPSFSLPSFSRKDPEVSKPAPPEPRRFGFRARGQAPEPEPTRSSFSLPSFSRKDPEVPKPAPPEPRLFGFGARRPEPVVVEEPEPAAFPTGALFASLAGLGVLSLVLSFNGADVQGAASGTIIDDKPGFEKMSLWPLLMVMTALPDDDKNEVTAVTDGVDDGEMASSVATSPSPQPTAEVAEAPKVFEPVPSKIDDFSDEAKALLDRYSKITTAIPDVPKPVTASLRERVLLSQRKSERAQAELDEARSKSKMKEYREYLNLKPANTSASASVEVAAELDEERSKSKMEESREYLNLKPASASSSAEVAADSTATTKSQASVEAPQATPLVAEAPPSLKAEAAEVAEVAEEEEEVEPTSKGWLSGFFDKAEPEAVKPEVEQSGAVVLAMDAEKAVPEKGPAPSPLEVVEVKEDKTDVPAVVAKAVLAAMGAEKGSAPSPQEAVEVKEDKKDAPAVVTKAGAAPGVVESLSTKSEEVVKVPEAVAKVGWPRWGGAGQAGVAKVGESAGVVETKEQAVVKLATKEEAAPSAASKEEVAAPVVAMEAEGAKDEKEKASPMVAKMEAAEAGTSTPAPALAEAAPAPVPETAPAPLVVEEEEELSMMESMAMEIQKASRIFDAAEDEEKGPVPVVAVSAAAAPNSTPATAPTDASPAPTPETAPTPVVEKEEKSPAPVASVNAAAAVDASPAPASVVVIPVPVVEVEEVEELSMMERMAMEIQKASGIFDATEEEEEIQAPIVAVSAAAASTSTPAAAPVDASPAPAPVTAPETAPAPAADNKEEESPAPTVAVSSPAASTYAPAAAPVDASPAPAPVTASALVVEEEEEEELSMMERMAMEIQKASGIFDAAEEEEEIPTPAIAVSAASAIASTPAPALTTASTPAPASAPAASPAAFPAAAPTPAPSSVAEEEEEELSDMERMSLEIQKASEVLDAAEEEKEEESPAPVVALNTAVTSAPASTPATTAAAPAPAVEEEEKEELSENERIAREIEMAAKMYMVDDAEEGEEVLPLKVGATAAVAAGASVTASAVSPRGPVEETPLMQATYPLAITAMALVTMKALDVALRTSKPRDPAAQAQLARAVQGAAPRVSRSVPPVAPALPSRKASASVPAVKLPGVKLPGMPGMQLPEMPGRPSKQIPGIKTPQVQMPSKGLPSVELPPLPMPSANIPSFSPKSGFKPDSNNSLDRARVERLLARVEEVMSEADGLINQIDLAQSSLFAQEPAKAGAKFAARRS